MAESAKRLFTMAGVEPEGDAFRIALDGRAVRTPKGAGLVVPTRKLADALAAEWNALDERIDPRALPLTKLANTAIDGVAKSRIAVLDDLARFGASDHLCYRAQAPAALAARQREAWDPWLAWAADTMGARLAVTEGIVFVSQPEVAVQALVGAAARLDNFALTAVHVAVGLTGSLVLSLALSQGRLQAEEAWAIATLDEAWQQEHSGVDAEAQARAEALQAELAHAARVFVLLSP